MTNCYCPKPNGQYVQQPEYKPAQYAQQECKPAQSTQPECKPMQYTQEYSKPMQYSQEYKTHYAHEPQYAHEYKPAPYVQQMPSECPKPYSPWEAIANKCHGLVPPQCRPPKPLCHDVSVLISELNSLTFPKLNYSCLPHAPSVPFPVEAKGVPLAFGFDARLVRDELHHSLLCYLAEGVSPKYLVAGTPSSRIESARQMAPYDKIDGYRSLQSFVYGSLLLSLNSVLLEDAPRNAGLDDTRLWSIAAPCATGNSTVELRVGGTPSVVLDLHPSTVVSNALIDAVLAAVKLGAVYDQCRGRVISDQVADACLHFDALTLLTQIWNRFASDLTRKGTSISWIILSNLERSVVFHRGSSEISVSHVIHNEGRSTPRDAVQNLYSLGLAVSVLEKHQYSHPTLVNLI